MNPPESPDDRKMLRACTRCRFLNVSTCTLRSLPIPHRPLNRHRGPLVVVGRRSLVRAVLASSEDESVDDPAADRSAKAGAGREGTGTVHGDMGASTVRGKASRAGEVGYTPGLPIHRLSAGLPRIACFDR